MNHTYIILHFQVHKKKEENKNNITVPWLCVATFAGILIVTNVDLLSFEESAVKTFDRQSTFCSTTGMLTRNVISTGGKARRSKLNMIKSQNCKSP